MITAPGGARRLTGDQTAALRDSLSDKPAKNIILLIGDGMGDSEITAARNYAEGASSFRQRYRCLTAYRAIHSLCAE
ncbi:alkaline phosphatase [Escherichia coli]